MIKYCHIFKTCVDIHLQLNVCGLLILHGLFFRNFKRFCQKYIMIINLKLHYIFLNLTYVVLVSLLFQS